MVAASCKTKKQNQYCWLVIVPCKTHQKCKTHN